MEHKAAQLERGKDFAERQAEELHKREQRAQSDLQDMSKLLTETRILLRNEESARKLADEALAGTQENCSTAEAAARQAQRDIKLAEEGRATAMNGLMQAERSLRESYNENVGWGMG